jgi:hypothetical protein
MSLLTSLTALLGYLVLALLAAGVASAAGDRHWALLVAVSAMLAYVPFNFATIPLQYGGHGSWRRDLAAAGPPFDCSEPSPGGPDHRR